MHLLKWGVYVFKGGAYVSEDGEHISKRGVYRSKRDIYGAKKGVHRSKKGIYRPKKVAHKSKEGVHEGIHTKWVEHARCKMNMANNWRKHKDERRRLQNVARAYGSLRRDCTSLPPWAQTD
jgi:hypothetical protein